MALSMCGLYIGTSKAILYIAIALVGYGNSNIFSMVLARALESEPKKQNEVSGLSDSFGQAGAVIVMAVGVIYLFTYISEIK